MYFQRAGLYNKVMTQFKFVSPYQAWRAINLILKIFIHPLNLFFLLYVDIFFYLTNMTSKHKKVLCWANSIDADQTADQGLLCLPFGCISIGSNIGIITATIWMYEFFRFLR